jgi:hypothetical protein
VRHEVSTTFGFAEDSFEVAGDDLIVNFDAAHRVYEAWLPEGAESATVTAVATEESADVMWVLRADCMPLADGDLPEGGGEFTLDEVPDGHSEDSKRAGDPGTAATSASDSPCAGPTCSSPVLRT